MTAVVEFAQAGVENTGRVNGVVLSSFDAVVPATAVEALSTIRAKGVRSSGSSEGGAPEGRVGGRERGGHHTPRRSVQVASGCSSL